MWYNQVNEAYRGEGYGAWKTAESGAAGGGAVPAGAVRGGNYPEYAVPYRKRRCPAVHGDASVPRRSAGKAGELLSGGDGGVFAQPGGDGEGPTAV